VLSILKARPVAQGNSTPVSDGQRRPLTVADRRRMASRPPSFTDALPWTRFDASDEAFVLNDGASLAALFEVDPTPTEAMPADVLQDLADKVRAALGGVPEEPQSPWIVQFFLNDDVDLTGLTADIAEYIRRTHEKNPERGEEILASDFTQAWLGEMSRHVANVSRPEGCFEDTQVSGNIWRAQLRRVRFVLYRKLALGPLRPDQEHSLREALDATATGLVAALREAQVGVRRCNGRDLYDWLLPFFNRPRGMQPSDLRAAAPYPGNDAASGDDEGSHAPIFGFDLAEQITLSCPRSDPDLGAWIFDGTFVKALTLQQMTLHPAIGHFTAEREYAEKNFARFDRLPPGSMLSITIVVQPQHLVRDQVERVQANSRAKTPEAEQTWIECRKVLQRMASGDKLVPMFLTLFLAGESPDELRAKTAAVTAQLTPSGLRFIQPGDDLTPLDAFLRGLPMCFDPAFDMKHMRRSRLVFMSHIAALLPVYGRHRGSGRPGLVLWNRGGDPLLVDVLNKHERKKNAHKLTFGPTGAGKSSKLNYECMSAMAIYRPRLFIVDAGESFRLLVEYFARHGLTTHMVRLTPQADVSLPPFVLATRLLDDPSVMDSFLAAERAGGTAGPEDDTLVPPLGDDDADAADDPNEERRDILGEMIIAAIMMITGGEASETEKLGRADRYLITRAIIRAAQAARAAGKPHPLAHDVAIQFIGMRNDPALSTRRQERAEEMGQAMLTFTQGLRGRLFNRMGSNWPDVDVTLVELGTLAKGGYEDALALAYTGLLDHVQAQGEAKQYEGRQTIALTDEGHLITKDPLLGPKVAKGTKMWRKLGIWFWLGTQNMHDFPDSMSRVLSMCEVWDLLAMEKAEIEEVARFKSLTREQRLMIESARKEPGKYTEGVLLSASKHVLYRNVPPPLAIALAMTEPEEKADRRRIMDEQQCSELEAAMHVARLLAQARRATGPGPALPGRKACHA
jgi:conjugative transfer ATPase